MPQNRSFLPPNTHSMPDVSDHATVIFKWIIIAGAGQLLDVCGIVSNIINIICFVKQGFKEPINISLFGKRKNNLCLHFNLPVCKQ